MRMRRREGFAIEPFWWIHASMMVVGAIVGLLLLSWRGLLIGLVVGELLLLVFMSLVTLKRRKQIVEQ